MNKSIVRLLLLLAMLAPAGLPAQDTGQDQDAPADTQDDSVPAPAQDGEPQAEENQAEETDPQGRFIPTEQISQDLGVSFPVDI